MASVPSAVKCSVVALAVSLLVGCDNILSHPSVPPQASQLARESVQTVRGLQPDVDQFIKGFRLQGPELAAVNQMSRAMFGVFQITDTGTAVRAAVEVKRAQACLAMVGIEASGLIEDLQRFIFSDDKARDYWLQFEAYMETLELPDMSGAVCDHNAPERALQTS